MNNDANKELRQAIDENNLAKVLLAIEHGADINNTSDVFGFYPPIIYCLSIEDDKETLLWQLLDLHEDINLDVNAGTKEGLTLLMLSINWGYWDTTEKLLENVEKYKLKVNVRRKCDKTDTALRRAEIVKRYHPTNRQIKRIYQRLLDLGATK